MLITGYRLGVDSDIIVGRLRRLGIWLMVDPQLSFSLSSVLKWRALDSAVACSWGRREFLVDCMVCKYLLDCDGFAKELVWWFLAERGPTTWLIFVLMSDVRRIMWSFSWGGLPTFEALALRFLFIIISLFKRLPSLAKFLMKFECFSSQSYG